MTIVLQPPQTVLGWAGAVLALLYLLWVLFLAVMPLYSAYLRSKVDPRVQIHPFTKVLGSPLVALMLFVDWFTNMTVMTVIMLELPQEKLVTQRLTRWSMDQDAYQGKIARFICDTMLNLFDPRGIHCF